MEGPRELRHQGGGGTLEECAKKAATAEQQRSITASAVGGKKSCAHASGTQEHEQQQLALAVHTILTVSSLLPEIGLHLANGSKTAQQPSVLTSRQSRTADAKTQVCRSTFCDCCVATRGGGRQCEP